MREAGAADEHEIVEHKRLKKVQRGEARFPGIRGRAHLQHGQKRAQTRDGEMGAAEAGQGNLTVAGQLRVPLVPVIVQEKRDELEEVFSGRAEAGGEGGAHPLGHGLQQAEQLLLLLRLI
jgi:hypothetical protein